MSSVSQLAEVLEQVLNEEACHLARETGFIERERNFDGADFAHSLIFGWLQDPQISLDGLIPRPGTPRGRSERIGLISALHQRMCHVLPTPSGAALSPADTSGGSGGLCLVAALWGGDRGG